MESKPASLLVVSLVKILNGTPPSLCGKQVGGQAVYPSWWPCLTKAMPTEHELIHMKDCGSQQHDILSVIETEGKSEKACSKGTKCFKNESLVALSTQF